MPEMKSGSSYGCAFSVPNLWGPLKFCLAVQKRRCECNFYLAQKDTSVGWGTEAEVSDLNSLSRGNPVPNQF